MFPTAEVKLPISDQRVSNKDPPGITFPFFSRFLHLLPRLTLRERPSFSSPCAITPSPRRIPGSSSSTPAYGRPPPFFLRLCKMIFSFPGLPPSLSPELAALKSHRSSPLYPPPFSLPYRFLNLYTLPLSELGSDACFRSTPKHLP